MKTEIQLFNQDMLAEAGKLLASRQARGRGIMSALTWRGLEHARNEGYEFCVTNWQTANLSASRTWPRFGFQTAAYRLARTINPMSAWAKL